MPDHTLSTPTCPLPLTDYPAVLLAHGGGGRLMHQLLARVFQAGGGHDGATLEIGGARLAFTTDSYVVHPLFFPGGDIGVLAVNGTVNDLAMCGARPLFLSAGYIIEEGLPMETLARVAESVRRAAAAAGVEIVTGDTKVVDRGKGDGVFINTAGIGIVEHDLAIGPESVRPGDVVLLNGDVGRHGMAIMAQREGLAFENVIESDCAPLAAPVLALLEAGVAVHCLRDCTRGGLATTLIEIAESAHLHVHLREMAISVRDDVRGACELLGLDPLYVANEGRFITFVPPADADRAVDILRRYCPDSRPIGQVREEAPGLVSIAGPLGAARLLDMFTGEQLPRIC